MPRYTEKSGCKDSLPPVTHSWEAALVADPKEPTQQAFETKE